MNDKDNAVIEALGRINRFAAANLAAFPAGSIALTDFARAGAIATELIPSDSTPGIPACAATGARNHLFDEVWEDLLAIADTARSIARKEPGFAADFRLGDDTLREIIATATAFLEKLQVPATAAKFIAYAMPAGFVADFQADLAAIDGKKSEQTDGCMEDIGDNAHNAPSSRKHATSSRPSTPPSKTASAAIPRSSPSGPPPHASTAQAAAAPSSPLRPLRDTGIPACSFSPPNPETAPSLGVGPFHSSRPVKPLMILERFP
jgi:hypothetical protein